MMSNGNGFASRMLKKQGWTEGDGLGKNRQGSAEPLKPTLKLDNAGIGYDAAEEFTSRWWESAYNKAVNTISVEKDDNEEGVDVVRRKTSKKKKRKEQAKMKKKTLYSQFVQTATLTNGKMTESVAAENSDSEEEIKPSGRTLTDEELFAACGGLTAHKGARHGHKMSAKQKRVEMQEQKLLEEMKKTYKLTSDSTCFPPKEEEKKVEGGKSKKRKRKGSESKTDGDQVEKKAKRKKKKRESN